MEIPDSVKASLSTEQLKKLEVRRGAVSCCLSEREVVRVGHCVARYTTKRRGVGQRRERAKFGRWRRVVWGGAGGQDPYSLFVMLMWRCRSCRSAFSPQVAAEKAKAAADKDLDPWFSEAEAEDNTFATFSQLSGITGKPATGAQDFLEANPYYDQR